MDKKPEWKNQMMPNDELKIKKYLFDYLSQESEASPELRNYANLMIKNEYKDPLALHQFQKESDRFIIRRCKRKAFLEVTKQNTENKNNESKNV